MSLDRTLNTFDAFIRRVKSGEVELTDEAIAECFSDLSDLALKVDGALSDLYMAARGHHQTYIDDTPALATDLSDAFDHAEAYFRGRCESIEGVKNPHVDGKLSNGKSFVPTYLKAKHDAWNAGRDSILEAMEAA